MSMLVFLRLFVYHVVVRGAGRMLNLGALKPGVEQDLPPYERLEWVVSAKSVICKSHQTSSDTNSHETSWTLLAQNGI